MLSCQQISRLAAHGEINIQILNTPVPTKLGVKGSFRQLLAPSSTPDVSVQVRRVRSPVPQLWGEHGQVALETLQWFLDLRLEVHDFRLVLFLLFIFEF